MEYNCLVRWRTSHLWRCYQRHLKRKLFAAIAISCFLVVVFYLNYLLDKVALRLPDIEISGPPSFCPPFNTSLPHENQQNDIFFLETSGEKCITPRQACSVESAARMNPHMTVTLYTNSVGSSPTRGSSMAHHRANSLGNKRNCDVMDTLEQIPNVALIRSQLTDELRETYLWDRWYDLGLLEQSQYPHVHLSDAVRVAIMYKQGGIYLDLDCIVLRPLHCIRNTAGYLSSLPSWVENGVLSFDRSHPFLNFLMKVMVQYYKPDLRESMGPPALGFALKFYCGIGLNTSFQHTTPYACYGGVPIQLQQPESFYAIPSEESWKFVEPHIDNAAVDRLANSYLTHVYFHTRDKVPLSSLYGTLARQYCPSIYKVLRKDF